MNETSSFDVSQENTPEAINAKVLQMQRDFSTHSGWAEFAVQYNTSIAQWKERRGNWQQYATQLWMWLRTYESYFQRTAMQSNRMESQERNKYIPADGQWHDWRHLERGQEPYQYRLHNGEVFIWHPTNRQMYVFRNNAWVRVTPRDSGAPAPNKKLPPVDDSRPPLTQSRPADSPPARATPAEDGERELDRGGLEWLAKALSTEHLVLSISLDRTIKKEDFVSIRNGLKTLRAVIQKLSSVEREALASQFIRILPPGMPSNKVPRSYYLSIDVCASEEEILAIIRAALKQDVFAIEVKKYLSPGSVRSFGASSNLTKIDDPVGVGQKLERVIQGLPGAAKKALAQLIVLLKDHSANWRGEGALSININSPDEELRYFLIASLIGDEAANGTKTVEQTMADKEQLQKDVVSLSAYHGGVTGGATLESSVTGRYADIDKGLREFRDNVVPHLAPSEQERLRDQSIRIVGADEKSRCGAYKLYLNFTKPNLAQTVQNFLGVQDVLSHVWIPGINLQFINAESLSDTWTPEAVEAKLQGILADLVVPQNARGTWGLYLDEGNKKTYVVGHVIHLNLTDETAEARKTLIEILERNRF